MVLHLVSFLYNYYVCFAFGFCFSFENGMHNQGMGLYGNLSTITYYCIIVIIII